MDKIKLVDSSFSHSVLGYSSDYQTSKLFTWDRTNIDINGNDLIVFTDSHIKSARNNKNSVGWIIEPVEIRPNLYSEIKNLKDNYLKIFTHEKTLIDLGHPFELLPFGCCWITSEDQKIYNKTINISIISSDKTQATGHKLRHSVISKFNDKFDVYGRKYNPIKNKIDGLMDYRFSIVIENCKRDYWFTEKLIDCLRTGTIPIYWGCPSIGDFFDIRGFILFDDINDLENILNNLTEEDYISKLEYVKENFKLSENFILPDDLIYKKITLQE